MIRTHGTGWNIKLIYQTIYMKKSLFLWCAVVMTALLSSCSNTSSDPITHVPFKEAKDGKWGMIAMDGKVLFKEEFKQMPTAVRDNRFFVKNKSGFWEMYDASEQPKKIGDEYKHVSVFNGGHALVSKRNEPVSIIDTDGKTVKVLDKIEGKTVNGVYAFNEGYAVFMTNDSLYGAIDDNGNCVIKPHYCGINSCSDGKFMAIDAKYKKFIDQKQPGKVKVSVITTSDKQLFEFAYDKYENFVSGFVDGKMPVSVKRDGKEIWGIIDDKGQYVVNPSNKFKKMGTVHGDKFTYSNGEAWGLMTLKGESLIRAKYDVLFYADDNSLVAGTSKKDEHEYKFINEKDEQIGNDTYEDVYLFSIFDGNHTLVKLNDKQYSIIDKKGESLKNLPDMVEAGLSRGDTYIESDYVDLQALVSAFQITPNGIMGFNYTSSPRDVVRKAAALGMLTGDKEHAAHSPYWFDYKDEVMLYKDVDGVRGMFSITFNGKLSRQTYRTKRVIDYEFYDYYYYHDEKIPTGYVWNKVSPHVFALSISNDGRMRGKLHQLYKVIVSRFKGMGTVVKQNDGAIVLNLRNGKRACIYMKKNNVVAIWGNIRKASEIDIKEFGDISNVDEGIDEAEDNDDTDVAEDTAVADSTAVDADE